MSATSASWIRSPQWNGNCAWGPQSSLEGGFHICTTWLIEAYLAVGRLDDALELFNRLVALFGPTGLLPEEYDPGTETHLGNHPQAYSHLGFIRCAQLLELNLAKADVE